jgi:hypothetical protein
VMARVLGLPTRVAVGFSYGVQDAAGVWHVKDSYAHAWPEVYFPGSGWVPFEPTPGRGIPGAQQYTGLAPAQQGQAPLSSDAAAPGLGSSKPGVSPSTTFRLPKGEANPAQATPRRKSNGTSSTVILVEWLAGITLVAGLWVAVVGGTWRLRRSWRRALLPVTDVAGAARQPRARRWARRWARLLRRPPPGQVEPAAAVLVAWIDASELLAWWGVIRSPDETYLEFGRRAGHRLRLALAMEPLAGAALLQLAQDATAAEYAPQVLTAEAPVRAAEAIARVEAALVGAAGIAQRVRLVLDPRLVFGHAARTRTRAARVARSGAGAAEAVGAAENLRGRPHAPTLQ